MAAPVPTSTLVDVDCSCGHYYGADDGRQDATAAPRSSMDASFVHLPRHEHAIKSASSVSRGLTDRYRHLKVLEQAIANPMDPPRLCIDCVQRVEQALLQDAERLDLECHRYREAVKEEESRLEIYKRTATDDGDLDAQEAAYQLEIAMLQEAVEAQEAEIRHLRSIQREQRLVEEELDQIEDALESQQNALELEARAFDNEQEQLYLQLSSTHAEAQRLSSSSICLPSILFRLQVDTERGLRYPLINDLRLAYRPKGDVRWDEIQAAWALAAQLLLTIGVTFQFQSMNWKLVPLSHCAKLIFYPVEGSDETKKRPVVYNLGHPRTDHSKSLLAWNGLLYQMVRHTTIKVHTAVDNGVLTEGEIPPLPFEISATKIGAIVLARLGADDDAGWSRAIHCMSCNLLWLSECAATFILQKVVLTAGSYA